MAGRVVRIEVEWLMRDGQSPNIPEALQQVVDALAGTTAKCGMICNSQGWCVGEYRVEIET